MSDFSVVITECLVCISLELGLTGLGIWCLTQLSTMKIFNSYSTDQVHIPPRKEQI
jgi:hypothetical protein